MPDESQTCDPPDTDTPQHRDIDRCVRGKAMSAAKLDLNRWLDRMLAGRRLVRFAA